MQEEHWPLHMREGRRPGDYVTHFIKQAGVCNSLTSRTRAVRGGAERFSVRAEVAQMCVWPQVQQSIRDHRTSE